MMFNKEQAYLILIMFKTQNFDRLVSDFVEVDNEYINLKVGDLTIVNEYGALWLEKTDWLFRIEYVNIFNTKESRFACCGGFPREIHHFNFFEHISFVDKV